MYQDHAETISIPPSIKTAPRSGSEPIEALLCEVMAFLSPSPKETNFEKSPEEPDFGSFHSDSAISDASYSLDSFQRSGVEVHITNGSSPSVDNSNEKPNRRIVEKWV